MGYFGDGNYTTITATDGNGYSFSLTANDDTSEDNDMLDIVVNQLAIIEATDNHKKQLCYIKEIFEENVFLKSRTGGEYLIDLNSEDWYPLYKDGKPAMVKRNIFGRIKKNFL